MTCKIFRAAQFSQKSPERKNNEQFSTRSSVVRPRENSVKFDALENREHFNFQQNKFEAEGLQLKQKWGTISPIEQAKLGMLQAKMEEFWLHGQSQTAHINRDLDGIAARSAEQFATSQSSSKYTLGKLGDKYEREADRVANFVTRQIHAPVRETPSDGESIQRMPSLQRDGTGEATVSSEVETQIDRARGGGQPLDNKVKESMGGAMGANFEGVKVHTDGTANRLNQQLHSRAFTTGPDVFFKRGEYRPGSTEGDRLIAHELTHVVQQGEGVQKKDACIQRSPLKPGYLNIVGENHDETGAREGFENKFLKFFLSEHEDAKSFGWGGIKTEGDAAYYSQNKNDEETEEYNNDNNEEYDDEEDENLVKLQVDSSYYRGLQGLVSGVSSALELKEMAQKDFDRISQLDEKQAITTIQEIYGMYERQCEIIIASLRDARELESVSQDYDDDWNLKTIRKMKSAELDRVGIKSKALQQTIANLMVEIEGLENQYQTILSSLNKFLPQKIDSNDENSQKASNASNDEMKSTRDRFKEIEMLCEKYAWETYRTVQKYCKPTALSQDSGSNNEELLISDIAHKSALEFYVKKDAVSDEVSFIRSEIMLDSVKKYQKQDLGSLGKVSEVYKVGNDHIKEMSIYMREVLIYAQEDNPSTELDNLKINLVSRDEFNWQLMDWAFKTNYWKNEDGWKKMVETVKNKSLHKKILQPFGPDWIEENLNEIISEYGADRDFLTWLGITNDILINK